jgi:hypothetical protein
MTKFNIIISYKEECNNITKIHGQSGMQKFMDKGECKKFLVTKHNLSPHSFMSMKFSSGCDHLFHEECGDSFTNIC